MDWNGVAQDQDSQAVEMLPSGYVSLFPVLLLGNVTPAKFHFKWDLKIEGFR